ncbi:hypothetical protein H632_c281p0 [Helicosporidium sp. ATCC 50920]|nr:hypothetical protein H632_c281p0 [Helicosporidium sp. ATCC 50920]|eukprot:KDD76291.1 hypothetical protein H632_c281p0 [Helicosporidium sp. ATCC 50920]
MKIWYRGGEAVDAHIRAEFSADLEALVSGELATWKSTPYGALAGIIVGDQFSRNAYRKLAKMFATDDLALQWAQELECKRMYEDIVHELQSRSGNPQAVKMAQVGLDYAIRHLNIVEKWGRFPHRNAVLGRESTPEEARGLADGSIEGF